MILKNRTSFYFCTQILFLSDSSSYVLNASTNTKYKENSDGGDVNG